MNKYGKILYSLPALNDYTFNQCSLCPQGNILADTRHAQCSWLTASSLISLQAYEGGGCEPGALSMPGISQYVSLRT